MELFRNTRLKIGRLILSKRMARTRRSIFYSRLDMVRSIGIVWDASNPDEFPLLARFCQKMNEKNIEVRILGYYPGNELPDKYTAIRYLTCLKKNETNYFHIPVSPESGSFIKNQFEILIDINFNRFLPLTYITNLSKARFKVGLFEPDVQDSPFDLMMEIKKPVNIESYLNQIIVYLEMINSKEKIIVE